MVVKKIKVGDTLASDTETVAPVKKSRRVAAVKAPVTAAEFLTKLMHKHNITINGLSHKLNVSRHEIRRILSGGTLSVETAHRLDLYFSMAADSWMNLHINAERYRLDPNNGSTVAASIIPM